MFRTRVQGQGLGTDAGRADLRCKGIKGLGFISYAGGADVPFVDSAARDCRFTL